MRHANIDLNVFDEPEFTDATPHQLGIWLRLYAYCARVENSGNILTVSGWSDQHSQRIAGCDKSELVAGSPLWHVRPGGMLTIYHYNLIAEEWSKKKRKTARMAGEQQSAAKTIAARSNGKRGGRPAKILRFVSSNSNNPT